MPVSRGSKHLEFQRPSDGMQDAPQFPSVRGSAIGTSWAATPASGSVTGVVRLPGKNTCFSEFPHSGGEDPLTGWR